jgi:asparagine synthase (glutamine-hydrolysing)
MCGIIAFTGTDEDLKRANAMLETLKHRGPDDHGSLTFPHCTLGQTRLSIIDLAGGHQPMRDNMRAMAITFNGEIYNYKELRKTLEEKGYQFSTHSDTEVILKCYQEYGTACPTYLDGMFAFVIWDEEKQALFAARDRFGKKPLYYTYDVDGNLLFASEIKALFASGKLRGEIDPGALDNYLALMYIPPTRTVYKNIFTLFPAEYAVYKDGVLVKNKYWKLEYSPIQISYDDAREEVRRLFGNAVQKRLIADVEIGSFLSGGVDSTLVTAYAQKFSNKPLKTFSLGYGEYRNELPYAKEAAEKIGTDHYTLQATEDLLEVLQESVAYFDEPHADSSDFPQSLLSKFAAQRVKVALSGDGADELFMGYGWYQKHWNLSFREHMFEKLFLNPFQGYLKNISVFDANERQELWKSGLSSVESFLSPEFRHTKLDSISKINLFDLTTYLPGQLLSKIDRMGMMHSLEVRSPFLDHELAEFTFNLPIEFKMNKNENKIILKDILNESMPKDFVHRRKQGFGAPVREWLQTSKMRSYVFQYLGKDALIFNYFRENIIEDLLNSFYSKGDESGYYRIWILLCLELWFRSHNEYHT